MKAGQVLDIYSKLIPKDTFSKRLPVQVFLARNRTIQEIQPLATGMIKTLREIAKIYGEDPQNIFHIADPAAQSEIIKLMSENVDAKIYKFPLSLLEQCDGEKYDVLTGEDFDRLFCLADAKE